MAFDWLTTMTPSSGHSRFVSAYRTELSDRASLMFRLGYPPSRATARLKANAMWDFERDGKMRPIGLSDRQIEDLVKQTYFRRPVLHT